MSLADLAGLIDGDMAACHDRPQACEHLDIECDDQVPLDVGIVEDDGADLKVLPIAQQRVQADVAFDMDPGSQPDRVVKDVVGAAQEPSCAGDAAVLVECGLIAHVCEVGEALGPGIALLQHAKGGAHPEALPGGLRTAVVIRSQGHGKMVGARRRARPPGRSGCAHGPARRTGKGKPLGGRLGGEAHRVAVIDRLEEAGLHRSTAQPVRPPDLNGGVREVGEHIHPRHEAAAEAKAAGDGVIMDLILACRSGIEGDEGAGVCHAYKARGSLAYRQRLAGR